jgi:Kef-type K+ transport system membrane component KefB
VMGAPVVWVFVFITCYAGYAGWPWPFAVVIGMIVGLVEVARLARDLGAAVLSQSTLQTVAFGAAYFSALYWLVRWLTR